MRGWTLALLLVFPLISGVAFAHEPDTFTVIVREDSHSPVEVNLVVNDAVALESWACNGCGNNDL